MAANQYKEALADYQGALQLPANLQEALNMGDRRPGHEQRPPGGSELPDRYCVRVIWG